MKPLPHGPSRKSSRTLCLLMSIASLLQDISEGKLTVGDLVLFLALMSQLYG